MALVRSVAAGGAETCLLLILYAAVFLSPLIFPPIPYVSLIPVVVGVVFIPLGRSFVFPNRAAAPLIAAAIVAGLLFTGVYMAAIDSAMRGSHGAVWPQPELIRSILIFAFSPFGALGAVSLSLVGYAGHYAGHYLGNKARASIQGKVA